MLVRSVLGKANDAVSYVDQVRHVLAPANRRKRVKSYIRRATSGLEESGLADITLDIFGLLVDL